MLIGKILEVVPNYSVGRDSKILEQIVDCFRGKEAVKLLDYSSDVDHNRSVITAIGNSEELVEAVFQSVKKAVDLIDLRVHKGEHPRLGAADVIPFVPLKNAGMDDAIMAALTLGKKVSDELNVPVYLYEKAAKFANRTNLAEIRKGGFEGLTEKMQNAVWQPDFGKPKPHISAGACIIGARAPLIAYNIMLETSDINIAKAIAQKIRFSSGGLPCLKAIGVYVAERAQAQVSMNLTDYTVTSLYDAFKAVENEAAAYGIAIASSEMIGLAPESAFLQVARQYLKLENYTDKMVLDKRIIEEDYI